MMTVTPIAKQHEPEVAIIGMGVFCPLGRNCAELKQSLLEGRDSIARITRFDTSRFVGDLASSFGEDVPVKVETDVQPWMDRATLFTVEAYHEAVGQTGFDLCDLDPERVGICLGSSHSGLVRTEEVAQSVLRGELDRLDPKVIAATMVSHCTSVIKRISGACGRVMTISSACASSNSAIGIGADLIRKGELDVVVTGGSDTVSLSVMAGFNALRAISPSKTAPFSNPPGLNIGEGAGIVMLKRADFDLVGCVAPLGEVLGYGLSGDAYHATAPDANGAGAEQAMLAALEDSGVVAAAIDYINAHGTGTEANDIAESRAVKRLFGESVPISTVKSFLGHTLGASGVIETIASILLTNDGLAPHNLRFDSVRRGCEGLDYVCGVPRKGDFNTIMTNNFGFGGNNSSLVLGSAKGRITRRPTTARPDTVVVTGIGITSAAGEGFVRFCNSLRAGKALAWKDQQSGVNVAYGPKLHFTDSDLRPFARSAPTVKFAIAALREAFGNDHGIYDHNPRSGLISGIVFGAQKPTEKYLESVFEGDPALASAHFFPMITLNATGGNCSLAFGVTGYTTTLCGSAAGLAYAADLVRHDRQERVAMVSSDELSSRLLSIYHRAGVVCLANELHHGRAKALGESAVALTLERAASVNERGATVLARLVGWSHRQDLVDLAVARDGSGLRRAVASVFRVAGLAATDIGLVCLLDHGLAPVQTACRRALKAVFGEHPPPILHPHRVFGLSPSSGAMVAVAAALAAFKQSEGELRYALVVGYDLIGDGFAFILERGAS